MGQLKKFVTPLHQATKRDCLARMNDDKVQCMNISKQYGEACNKLGLKIASCQLGCFK